MATRFSTLARIVFAISAMPLMTACGDRSEDEANRAAIDSMQAARERGETDLSNPEMGSKMSVQLTEFAVQQSHTEVPEGQLTIVVENKGQQAHSFVVQGAGLNQNSGAIPAGGYVLMSFIADGGTYDLFCPDSSGVHRSRGMAGKLLVKDKIVYPTDSVGKAAAESASSR